MTDIDATFWAMTRTAAMVIFVLMLLSAAIAWVITKSVVTPLSVLKARMAGLSAGELHAPVSATDRPDEIGEMARTVQVFKSAMIETERMRAEQLELEKRQDQRRRADMSQLADGFEGAVGAATQQQYPTCSGGHVSGGFEYHRRAARRQRDRIGLHAGPDGCKITVQRKQSIEARGRQVHEFGTCRLTIRGNATGTC